MRETDCKGGVSSWLGGEGDGECYPYNCLLCLAVSAVRSSSSMLVHTHQTWKYARTYQLSLPCLCKNKRSVKPKRPYPTLRLHAGKQQASDVSLCELGNFYGHRLTSQDEGKRVALVFTQTHFSCPTEC